jgi:hypothetical protein
MMATEKDLLDKADALLRRHALGAAGGETGTYPVLTDLIGAPEPQQPDTSLREELVERVLKELRTQVGVEMERQVAETLAPQLRAAVAEALAGMQERLATLVAEAVAKALEERGPVK